MKTKLVIVSHVHDKTGSFVKLRARMASNLVFSVSFPIVKSHANIAETLLPNSSNLLLSPHFGSRINVLIKQLKNPIK